MICVNLQEAFNLFCVLFVDSSQINAQNDSPEVCVLFDIKDTLFINKKINILL